MKKLAFVTPWFGMDIHGGAEAEARELAMHLAEAGAEVEVLTTCVKAFNSDWNKNHYKEGEYTEGGIIVRRFKADKRDARAFDAVNAKLISGIHISRDEEEVFLQNMVNSSRLYEYIRGHQDEYSVFMFIPYMFGTTYYGCRICPEKSVLIPCFHDESYFYLESFKTAFSRVAGIIYNAAPEKELTERNYPLNEDVKQIVMGIGMDTSQQGDADRFRKKHVINDPFILYAGRKDKGKNTDTLIQYFREYKMRSSAHSDLKLVLIGGGEVSIPADIRDDVIDLGFVERQDKYDAYAAAELLCQPSRHESFSFVIMESWLAGRPVLVADQCEVTKNFCRESNGGLWFRDYFEFEGALNHLFNEPTEAIAIGHSGRSYVIRHFAWDAIVSKYYDYFGELIN